MKKFLSIYTLLIGASIGLQSCFFSEKDVFEESSANRATADAVKCQEILKNVPNGWKLEYYIGREYSMGAVTFLMKFDGMQVQIASETGTNDYKPSDRVTSLYQVKSEQSTMLTIDSYNSLLHAYATPLGTNMNLEGDYEFIVMSASPDKIVLQGKRYKNIMEMTPMPKDIPWHIHIQDILSIEKEAFFNTYRMEKGGQALAYFKRDNHTMSTFSVYNASHTSDPKNLSYIYTDKGLKFQAPQSINGKTVQNFNWDRKSRLFICTDVDATDITLKEYRPEGYLPYEDYLGNYAATIYDNAEGETTVPVAITRKTKGESYTLKGIGNLSIILQYDKATGKLVLDSQKLGVDPVSGFYFACAAGIEGYAHSELSMPARLRSGLINVVQSTTPFTFYLADKTTQENTQLIIWAYSSEKYSSSTVLGYWSWYNLISMTKVDNEN